MSTSSVSSNLQAQGANADDRIRPEVRIVAVLVIIILILAVAVLYVNPDKTDQYFSWTIKPNLTALAMGAGYLMGIYFFARVATLPHWHSVAIGFLPITSFTIWMLLATLLHWDRFHQGTMAFALWTIIYIITPFLVPFLWFRNRAADPGAGAFNEAPVPLLLRRAAAVVGAALLLVTVSCFLFPQALIAVFPWQLTPLTARVVTGWLSFPAIGGLLLSREPRWSSWRIILEAAFVGILFFVLALPRAWGDLNTSNPLAWVLVVGLVGILIATPFFYMAMQRRAGMAGA